MHLFRNVCHNDEEGKDSFFVRPTATKKKIIVYKVHHKILFFLSKTFFFQ